MGRRINGIGKFKHLIFMKKMIFFVALLSAALTSPCLMAQDLKAEMQAVVDEYTAAQKRSDAVASAALHADSFATVNVIEGKTTMRMKAEQLTRMTKYFSEYTQIPDITLGTVELLPDGRARMTGKYTSIETQKATGEQRTFSGTFDNLLKKVNGRWVFCQTKLTPSMQTIELSLADFSKKYEDAYNKEDHATLQTYWTADAVRVYKDGSTITSAAAIGAHHAKTFENQDVVLTTTVTSVSRGDDEHAYIQKGTFQVTGVNTKGEKIDISGSFTRTMVQVNGAWKIAKTVLAD
jgi:ketosteroid isomerase-like protein